MGAKRLKVFIFSAIAFVMLLGITLISVSFAKWDGGVSTATASGSVGKFYVDYPYTASVSNAPIESDTYYLVVDQTNGVKDFHKLGAGGNSSERYIGGVYLEGNVPVSFYLGSNNVGKGKLSQENTGYHGNVSKADGIFTPSYSAFFDITFKIESGGYKLYVNSNYPNTVNIKFSDNKTVVFKLISASINIHIFNRVVSNGKNVDTILTTNSSGAKAWPGTSCTASYSSTATTAGNTHNISIDAKSTDNVYIMFNYIKSGTTTTYYKTLEQKISTYYSMTEINYLSFSEGSKISGDTNGDYRLNQTKNTVTMLTPVSAAEDGADDKVVRKVTGKTTKADGQTVYTYHNYVCVSREGGTGATMAYVNFKVSDFKDVGVTGFKVTRSSTDADGLPASDKTDVFIYNDPTGKMLSAINATTDDTETIPDAVKDHVNSNYVVGGTYIMLYFGTGTEQYYALDVEIETSAETTFTLTATASNIDWRNRFDTGYGYPYGYYLGGEFNGMGMWDPRKAARFDKNGDWAEDDVTLKFDDRTDSFKAPGYIDVTLEVELTAKGDTLKLYRLGADGKRENGTEPTLWFIPRNILKNYTGGTGTGDASLFNKDMNIIISEPGTYRIHYEGDVTYKSDNLYAYDRDGKKFMTKTEYYALGASDTVIAAIKASDGERRYAVIDNWNGVVENLYVTRLETGGDVVSEINVTYHLNGGTLAGVTGDSVTEKASWGAVLGADSTVNKTPQKDGFTFAGWFDKPQGQSGATQYTKDTLITSTESINLYAYYTEDSPEPITYSITYNVGSGTNNASNPSAFTVGSGTVTLKNPTAPTGKQFKEWRKDNASGQVVTSITDANAATLASGTTITLFAVYEDITYTVSFSLNYTGATGAPASQTVTYGGKVTKPTDPIRLGWTFGGWYTTSACTGSSYNFSSTVTSALPTLYAKWTADYYMVNGSTQTLLPQNGTGSEYAVFGVELAKDTNLSFRKGDTIYTLTLNDYASTVNTVSGKKSIVTKANGFYDIYLQNPTTSGTSSTATIYTAFAKNNTTCAYDIYVEGTWGNGGNGTLEKRLVVSNVKDSETVEFSYYIPDNTKFRFEIHAHGNDTTSVYDHGWGGSNGSSYMYDWDNTYFWTEKNQGKANKMFSFSIKVRDWQSTKITNAETRY